MQKMIETLFSNSNNSWSMGSFGAIAEFTWDDNEKVESIQDAATGRITERGAMVITPHAQLKPIAYETLRKDPQSWGQAVAFCLPETLAQRETLDKLTELGPDSGSLKAESKDHILFDIGLNLKFIDVCIRTNDADLIQRLRQACGKSLFETGNTIMQDIIQASPTRVFITNISRAEVYQEIGLVKAPEGPHTHVLPKLLSAGRAFSANTPIPKGYLPMLTLHAANPCRDKKGNNKDFEFSDHQSFQIMMSDWADDDYIQQKNRTWKALTEGSQPEGFDSGENRHLRTATRISIRQYHHLHAEKDALIAQWREAFDKAVNTEELAD